MLSRQAQFWSASLLTCFHVSRAHWELLGGECISGFLEHIYSLSESLVKCLPRECFKLSSVLLGHSVWFSLCVFLVPKALVCLEERI